MGRRRTQPRRQAAADAVQGKNAAAVAVPLRRPVATGPWSKADWMSLFAAGIIVLAVLAAYRNSLCVPFLFDDEDSIAKNPTIQRFWPVWKTFCPPNLGETVTDRPMLNFTLAISYAMSGLDVWGYHVGNLCIHAIASLLLFGVLHRTFRLPSMCERWGKVALPLSFVTALFWAIHPLQTESVTYIVQRAESLMGMFYLLTLYCVIRSATASKTWSAVWCVAASFACFAGMASKEVMVSAPIVVFFYDRAFLTGSFRETFRRRYGLYAVFAGSWVLLGWLVFGGAAKVGIGVGMSWWAYFGTQCWAVAHYLRLCVVPYPLLFDYGDYLAHGFWNIAPYAAILFGLAAATVLALWRNRKTGVLGLCFFAILAPTSSILPACVTQTVAEHRMYLPLAAVLTALTVGAWTAGEYMVRRGALSSRAFSATGVLLSLVVCIVFGALTFYRNVDYRSEFSIWQDSLNKAPYNSRNHNNLGLAWAALDRLDEAEACFRQALVVKPRNAQAYYNLATIFLRRGSPDEAVEQYRLALQYNPNYLEAYYNLGIALATNGRTAEAVANDREALQKFPNARDVCSHLALLLATCPDESLRDGEEAVALAKRAVELSDGETPGVLGTLAAAYAEHGEFPEAVATTRRAIDLAARQGNAMLAEGLSLKLKFYEAGKPFHNPPLEKADERGAAPATAR
jgi:tetratricopeptide (TPR) repeat protein